MKIPPKLAPRLAELLLSLWGRPNQAGGDTLTTTSSQGARGEAVAGAGSHEDPVAGGEDAGNLSTDGAMVTMVTHAGCEVGQYPLVISHSYQKSLFG